MTAKKPSHQNRKTTAGAPDGMDVASCLQALYTDLKASAELHIFQTLIGDTVVEVAASYVNLEGITSHHGTWRIFTPYSAPILALAVQCCHWTYHDIDRQQARDLIEAHRVAPDGE